MNVIVTRPEEDGTPLKTKLEAMGHRVILMPLLRIMPRRPVFIRKLPYQAVVATSANGIRALAGHPELKSIRMLTVGPQSMTAAKDAGFLSVEAHGGDLHGLVAHIKKSLRPAAGPILYLSGNETAGDLEGHLTKAGFDCWRAIVYDAVQAKDPGPAEAALRGRTADAVLLYSPRSARIWCKIVWDAGLAEEAASAHYFCLSKNVAATLPKTWARTVAKSPDEAAMLALLEPGHGTR
ncbi:MAG: uroporphyrinogen-III synthase [Aestuariivirga sp.]